MNRLWVRLSLAFVAVVLLGFGAIVLPAILLVSPQRIHTYMLDQLEQPEGLVDALADHYRTQGNWQDVEMLMTGANAAFLVEPGAQNISLLLTDTDGTIVYHEQAAMVGQRLSQNRLTQTAQVQVEEQVVGHLAILRSTSAAVESSDSASLLSYLRLENVPQFMQEAFTFLLRVAAISGVFGLLFGVLASRMLTAPLSNLVNAAIAVGARRWDVRVPVEGSEELQAAARAFNNMAAALEEAEVLRRNLLADVAHELRTPLTVLQGNLRAILDDIYALDKAEIARLYDQTRHLHRLVNDLHELAQAEAHQLPLNRQHLDLVAVVEETAALFESMAEERDVRLQVHTRPQPVQICADRARIVQVLQNLLTNALRHTPEDGCIEIAMSTQAGGVSISVVDTGEGILPEHLPQVFDRFYRTDTARSRDSGGAGLGLAIVRALVEEHGGRVAAESPGPGGGATFTIWLPLRQSNVPFS